MTVKFKGFICLLFYVFVIEFFFACRESKLSQNIHCNINNKELKIDLKKVKGFRELKEEFPANYVDYKNTVDSLKLINYDTVAFFIRPCFTHMGVIFTVQKSILTSFYYNFTGGKRQIIRLNNNCNMAQNYFTFLNQEIKKSAIIKDTVLTIPDCTVNIFLKINTSYYQRKISYSEVNLDTGSNIEFKKLIYQCDSIMRIYLN